MTFMHISDLHFAGNATSYNTQEILFNEAERIFKDIPINEKFLIITGDFHNYNDNGYEKAESFLKEFIKKMGIDIHKDVFVIPGNHDDGNESALNSLLISIDPIWKKHNTSAITMIKNGDMGYVDERARAFRPYSQFMQNIGIYDATDDPDYPSKTHIRNWRGKLNILHLNTAIISDGTAKTNQMTDVDTAADSKTWKGFYQDDIPSIALGHNNFYDLVDTQRNQLQQTFALKKISAYLCGDNHRYEDNPERQIIPVERNDGKRKVIPNLVAMRGIADEKDSFSHIGFCVHRWDEATDKVTVEFRTWDKGIIASTVGYGENVCYEMRRIKSKNNICNHSTEQPQSEPQILNIHKAKENIKEALQSLYRNLKCFRQAIRNSDVVNVNKSLSMIKTDVTRMYDIGEECKFLNKELSKIAMSIVDQYNSFAVPYSMFVKSEDRNSPAGVWYTRQAEKEFKALLDLVLLKLELLTNNDGYTDNVFFKVSLSERGGRLFIYSSDCYSEKDRLKTTISKEIWDRFVMCCKELLVAVFSETDMEYININLNKKLGDYYCAPNDGNNHYDEQYRIDFKVKLIRNDSNNSFDSIHFDIGEDFDVSLFKSGKFIFRGSDENTKLSDYGINEEALIKAAVNMLKFTTGKDKVIISKQFRRQVYSDGSGGYILDYIIPD